MITKQETEIVQLKKEKTQLKEEKDALVDRLQRKEDYWGSLYMKLFKVYEGKGDLAKAFADEYEEMRS